MLHVLDDHAPIVMKLITHQSNSLWVAVIMVEDRLDNGTAKSYIPIDFFFKVTSAEMQRLHLPKFPRLSTVSVGSKKIFTIKSTDDSGVAPTISIVNEPSFRQR